MKCHYTINVEWTGNTGQGTSNYRAYERSHTIRASNKADLYGSSDPAFRGDATKWNPEELLLAALSSCHMLWYLHMCSNAGIIVVRYADTPSGDMELDSSGGGAFTRATLNPVIAITDENRIEEAKALHRQAHDKCFIARSVNFPVIIDSSVTVVPPC